MPRIEWTRLDGGDVETVIGILLAREHRHSRRIRPSQGDRGVDVRVRRKADTFNVFQIKRFAANLTQRQKNQIVGSFETFREYAAEKNLKVGSWYLVLPLNPTPENSDWFDEFTEEAPFDCDWLGLDFVEGLAAKYPEVIDYYLRDGKERLEAAISDLTKIILLDRDLTRRSETEAAQLQPRDVQDTLFALYDELNRYDPHYRYEFAVEGASREVPNDPGLVFATRLGDGEKFITFKVFSRFDEATDERPIPIELRWNVEEGSETAARIEEWAKFGVPFTAPLGSADLKMDLPGGLGGEIEGAGVSFGPAAVGSPYELRAEIVDEGGAVVASAHLKMGGRTVGLGGVGIRATGEEANGAFTIEMRFDTAAESGTFSLTFSGIEGKRPADVLPGMKFLAAFHSPHALRFGPVHGPAIDQRFAIPHSWSGAGELGVQVVEALARIQERTHVQITVPDLLDWAPRQIEEFVRIGKLLRGESVTTEWSPFELRARPDAGEVAGDGVSVLLDLPLSVRLGGADIALGTLRRHLRAAKIEVLDATPGGDGLVPARLVPLDGNTSAVDTFVPATGEDSPVRDGGPA